MESRGWYSLRKRIVLGVHRYTKLRKVSSNIFWQVRNILYNPAFTKNKHSSASGTNKLRRILQFRYCIRAAYSSWRLRGLDPAKWTSGDVSFKCNSRNTLKAYRHPVQHSKEGSSWRISINVLTPCYFRLMPLPYHTTVDFELILKYIWSSSTQDGTIELYRKYVLDIQLIFLQRTDSNGRRLHSIFFRSSWKPWLIIGCMEEFRYFKQLSIGNYE